jgi:hypothetical protein
MKTLAPFVLAALLGAPAFAQEPVRPAAPESKPAEAAKDRRMGLAKPIVMEKDREVYGGEPTLKETTKLEDIVKDPKAYDGKRVKVAGVIQDVCQKKGCFLFLKDGDVKTQVKFKDYAFFVPLDCAGRKIVVEGVPKVTLLKEALRRHYAEDQGKPKAEIEKIKGDETVVMLMVEAVEIGCAAPASPAESRPAKGKE